MLDEVRLVIDASTSRRLLRVALRGLVQPRVRPERTVSSAGSLYVRLFHDRVRN